MRILLVFLLALSCRLVSAQGELNYTFTLMNDRGAPMGGVSVRITNQDKGTTNSYTTDGTGSVKIRLKSEDGLVYSLSYMDHENEITLNVPENGIRTSSKKVTYRSLSELQAEKPESRDGIDFKSITRPSAGSSVFVIRLMDNNKAPFTGEVSVKLVDVKGAQILSPSSKGSGSYSFYVEPSKTYEVDVAGAPCLDKITAGPLGSEFSQSISYVLSNVKEEAKGDTIMQSNAASANKSTDRLRFTINIKDYDGNPLVNEWIYLKEIEGRRVYAGKSDELGKVVFQLPKTADFSLNLKHEGNLRKVDCKRQAKGFSEGNMTFSNAGYEAYLAELKRREEERRREAIRQLELAQQRADEAKIQAQMKLDNEKRMANRRKAYDPKVFKTEFRTTPVEDYKTPIAVTKTANGYLVDPGLGNNVGTPLVTGSNVIAYSGFYSNVLYSFNAATGAINWAKSLAESGPSALVYQDGVLLVYTYSCTLYAFDAIAGNLLWSKYLTSTVYSTPSVSGGKVIAVYHDEIGKVAGCFDLRTGAIKWQRGILGECVGAPVIAANKVFITCMEGTLEIMDLATGAGVKSMDIKAISSPTIIGEHMYVTHVNGSNQEVIGKYALAGFQLSKDLSVLDGMIDMRNEQGSEQNMTYTGSRVLGYKGLSYFLTGLSLKCLDPVSESVVWTKALAVRNSSGMMQAIAVDNMIAVGNLNGVMNFYDHKTGTQVLEVNLGRKIASAPTIANNCIYAGSTNGQLIVHKLPKPMQSPGTQWGGSASHNTSF